MGDSNPAEEISAKIDHEQQSPPLPPARNSKVNVTGLNQYHLALDEALSGNKK